MMNKLLTLLAATTLPVTCLAPELFAQSSEGEQVIAVLDMNTIEWENYDREACARMLGREGHISLEVHNNNFNHWLGKDRWWPGAVVRWRNIYIRELD